MKEVYKPLFEPFTFPNGVQLKNRVVMAPMTTFSANPDDIHIILKGNSDSYNIILNHDGVFLLTNVAAGSYTLEVYDNNNQKLYSHPIEIKTGQVYRPEISLD